LHKYERPACLFCRDYSAELADISVGGLATEGWTITVIRTNAGNNIFQGAIKKGILTANEIGLESKQLKLLKKLCDKKRTRSLPMIKTVFSP
jgi:coenzyme F420 hydrogenase subunit beta